MSYSSANMYTTWSCCCTCLTRLQDLSLHPEHFHSRKYTCNKSDHVWLQREHDIFLALPKALLHAAHARVCPSRSL